MEHRFLGSGTYGCVIHPPLIDQNSGIDMDIHVGKVMDVEEGNEERYANEELEASEILRDIDPEQEYFIYPLFKSYVRVQDVIHSVQNIDCDFLKKKNKQDQLPQLIMKYGGIPLQTHLKVTYKTHGLLSRRKMIDLLIPLFKGVGRLIENKCAHQDIKMNNIIVDDEHVRLIDFGLLVDNHKFYNENVMFENQKYAVNPPEYRMLNCVNLDEMSCSKISKDEIDLMKSYIKTFWKLDPLWLSYYGIGNTIYLASFRKMRNALLEKKTIEERIQVLKEMDTIAKSDLYSIGFLLLQVSSLMLPPNEDRPDAVRYYKLLVHGLLHPCPEYRLDFQSAMDYVSHIQEDG